MTTHIEALTVYTLRLLAAAMGLFSLLEIGGWL